MKGIIIMTGAALLAMVPASLGLIGNASFAQSVPVRVPSQATLGGGQSKHIEIGDDNGGAGTHAKPGDDNGGVGTHAEPGDDNSGVGTHAQPGDDKGGLSTPHVQTNNAKVSTSTSGKVDNGPKADAKGGSDDGAGHK